MGGAANFYFQIAPWNQFNGLSASRIWWFNSIELHRNLASVNLQFVNSFLDTLFFSLGFGQSMSFLKIEFCLLRIKAFVKLSQQ